MQGQAVDVGVARPEALALVQAVGGAARRARGQVDGATAQLAGTGDPGDVALRELAAIVVDLGGAAAVTAEIERRLELAEHALSRIDITESVRADLVAAARYVTARDR